MYNVVVHTRVAYPWGLTSQTLAAVPKRAPPHRVFMYTPSSGFFLFSVEFTHQFVPDRRYTHACIIYTPRERGREENDHNSFRRSRPLSPPVLPGRGGSINWIESRRRVVGGSRIARIRDVINATGGGGDVYLHPADGEK